MKHKPHTIFIFLLFLFLHLYKLSEIPFAINVDEAGLWYNVQCLLNYGVDQGNNSWPILFANFYGEQSAMYTYLAFICVKLFGNSLFAIRLPAVIGACLIFVFGYKIVNKLYNNDKVNLLFCILCTICPYFIVEFRYALDCNLMLGFSTMFLWFFIKAIDTKKNLDTIISGLTCGLTLWTYGLSYISMPLFLIVSVIYLLNNKKITLKQVVAFAISVFILALPLIIVQIINILDLSELVIANITFTKFEYSRHLEISCSNFLSNIFTYAIYFLIGNIISSESILYTNYYIFSIVFVCIGFISFIIKLFHTLKEKEYANFFFVPLWFYSNFITVLFISVNQRYYQLNACMFIGLLFLVEGIFQLMNYLKTIMTKTTIKAIFLIIVVVYIISFILFFNYYFGPSYNEYIITYNEYNEPLNNVLNIIDKDELCGFLVSPIYYKIITEEHPFKHPFKYSITEDHKVLEHHYPYENFMFSDNSNIFQTVNPNAMYVVPIRMLPEMIHLYKFDFEQIKIGNYIVFRPN